MRYIRHTALIITLFIVLSLASLPVYAGDATVNTCDYASLSSAIATANSGGGTITFNCSGTITFTSEFAIVADVTMNANGNTVIFDAGGSTRHFTVNAFVTFSLDGFTLQNGNGSSGAGGAINNNGTLNINNSSFINNTANSAGGAKYG